jgi:hypothetical protein
MDFEMNPNWERDLQRDLKRQLDPQLQKMFDAVFDRCAGQPVSDVKAVLKLEFERRIGGSITDPHLTEYASAITSGRRLRVR